MPLDKSNFLYMLGPNIYLPQLLRAFKSLYKGPIAEAFSGSRRERKAENPQFLFSVLTGFFNLELALPHGK